MNLSLEEYTNLIDTEISQTALNQINLTLKYLDRDYDDYSIERYQQHRWKLSGMIMKHQIFSQKNQKTC